MKENELNLSEENKNLIHEWTIEQVESASKPNFGKVFVTAPNLLNLIGDINGKDILELGCGNGYWLRLIARTNARLAGIDLAENQIQAAREWDDPAVVSIDYRVGNVSEALDLQGKFDVAFFDHVLLEIPTKEGLEHAIQNAADTLKPGGSLVISDLYPFAPSSRPDNLCVADDFNYFDSAAPFEIQSKRIDGEVIYYKDVHWTLSDNTDAITKAGLKITHIIEPVPSVEDVAQYPDELGYRLNHPMAIMFRAVKQWQLKPLSLIVLASSL